MTFKGIGPMVDSKQEFKLFLQGTGFKTSDRVDATIRLTINTTFQRQGFVSKVVAGLGAFAQFDMVTDTDIPEIPEDEDVVVITVVVNGETQQTTGGMPP